LLDSLLQEKEIASMQISMLGCETVGEVWL